MIFCMRVVSFCQVLLVAFVRWMVVTKTPIDSEGFHFCVVSTERPYLFFYKRGGSIHILGLLRHILWVRLRILVMEKMIFKNSVWATAVVVCKWTRIFLFLVTWTKVTWYSCFSRGSKFNWSFETNHWVSNGNSILLFFYVGVRILKKKLSFRDGF